MISHLFSFSGRIGRAKWWGAQAAGLICLSLSLILEASLLRHSQNGTSPVWIVYGLLIGISAWIILASTSARYHDRDKSAWWLILGLIPVVGLWQVIECGFLPGIIYDNEYGNCPI
jgi:uncharacterized membrane protein YhaH (DUF805 family)